MSFKNNYRVRKRESLEPFSKLGLFILFSGIVSVFARLTSALDCYACGLGMVDPLSENFAYNLEPGDTVAKMYNETCTVFEAFLAEYPNSMNKWIRPCPPNVVSCFWAEGSYNSESK
jgi:hypothetical protein